MDETRPLLQGARLTAWELRHAGIPHRVVADSAAGSLMAQGRVDRVIVGADRIAANGDVANKVGTYPLAVLADRHGVPFYVAAPLSTIDPATPDGAAIPIEERDPAEVVHGGDAFNPAFDVTPAELVTAIVTEAGVLKPPYPPARFPQCVDMSERRCASLLGAAAARARHRRRRGRGGRACDGGGLSRSRRPADRGRRHLGAAADRPRTRGRGRRPRSRARAGSPRACSRQAASTRVRESGVLFAESRMAELLGEETVLVDATLGPAAIADGLAAAAAELAADLIVFVDVGGDALAHGDEPGLASPLCDAIMLAAAAHRSAKSTSGPGARRRSSASAATAS